MGHSPLNSQQSPLIISQDPCKPLQSDCFQTQPIPRCWPLSLTIAHYSVQSSPFYITHHASFWCCQSMLIGASEMVSDRDLNLPGLRHSPCSIHCWLSAITLAKLPEFADFPSALLLVLWTFLLCPRAASCWSCSHALTLLLDAGQGVDLEANQMLG